MAPHLAAVDYILDDFSQFLKSDVYIAKQNELTDRLCLLDIVWLWLEHGDGYVVCQTFETLLLFLVYAIDDFVRSDMSGIFGLDLRPSRFDETAFVEGILTSVHESPELARRAHPALDRHEFEHGLGRRLQMRGAMPPLA